MKQNICQAIHIAKTLITWKVAKKSRHTTALIDNQGFNVIYKPFCIDIDGFNKGEDPFGYGIRVDGKIIPGKKADEWLQKSIQEKE